MTLNSPSWCTLCVGKGEEQKVHGDGAEAGPESLNRKVGGAIRHASLGFMD